MGKPKNTWRRRPFAAVASLLITVLTVAACGADGEGGAQSETEPIRILALLATSGISAPSGEPLLAGVKAAADVVNANGGVNGRKVEVKTLNTQSDPTRAVSLFQGEVAASKPDLVFAGTSSSELVALAAATTAAKVPVICPNQAAAAGDAATNPYIFSGAGASVVQSQYFAKLFKDKGYTNAGLLVPNSAVGEAQEAPYAKAFQDLGLTLRIEKYGAADLDMSAPLTRLRDAGTQAVVFFSVGPAGGYIIKSRAKIGFDAPFYGDSAVATGNISGLFTAEEAEGVVLNAYQVSVAQTDAEMLPGKKKLIATLAEENVTYTTPLLTYALSYDTVLASMNAFIAVGKTDDPDGWRAAMENNPTTPFDPAMSSKFDWTKDSHFRGDPGPYVLIPASTQLVNGQYDVL
ncbi:ABC transporter substrate-binding protein [Acrocarpospora catenulata]|uniref:ABC transporter substrate-binding protein n=1 Tax=Acrocarpospora catenulata TaxID=2836182 RepID=UPI001BD98CA2|nr:ABC transporter substrate-binding protein [Acrocarpospora catenulata]